MALNSTERLQETFSLALEHRGRALHDLVTNSNVLTAVLKKRGASKVVSGPTIRESYLFDESGSFLWYSGYQTLNPTPKELVNDAEWTPKQCAVSVTLPNSDILKNAGTNQIRDIFETHIDAAEGEMTDRFNEGLHSDGTGYGGLEIGGLQLAVPTDPTTGTYAGIDRSAQPQWRTASYDIDTDFTGITQLTASNVHNLYTKVIIARTRGKRKPNLILASQEHYEAFMEATNAIQRITSTESDLAKLGFSAVAYHGAGAKIEVVLEGGIGTAMPANTTYFLDSRSIKLRHYEGRNFEKIGGKQMPINQDAIVQHIGWMGELCMCQPFFNAKLYDSDPAS